MTVVLYLRKIANMLVSVILVPKGIRILNVAHTDGISTTVLTDQP